MRTVREQPKDRSGAGLHILQYVCWIKFSISLSYYTAMHSCIHVKAITVWESQRHSITCINSNNVVISSASSAMFCFGNICMIWKKKKICFYYKYKQLLQYSRYTFKCDLPFCLNIRKNMLLLTKRIRSSFWYFIYFFLLFFLCYPISPRLIPWVCD